MYGVNGLMNCVLSVPDQIDEEQSPEEADEVDSRDVLP